MTDTELKQLQENWDNAPASEAFYPLARAYFDMGLYDAAADVLRRGLHNLPDHAEGLSLLGQVHSKRADYDEARDCFEKALKYDSACIAPMRGLAEIEIAAGNSSRAESWIVRVESQGEKSLSRHLRRELERIQDTSSIAEAEIPFVTETMVDLYLKQGMKEKAVFALRQLIEQKPEDTSLRQRLDQLLPTLVRPEGETQRPLSVESRLNAWLRAVRHRKQRR